MIAMSVAEPADVSLQARADADLARRLRVSVVSYFVLWLVLATASDLVAHAPLATLVPGVLFLLLGAWRLDLSLRFEHHYRCAAEGWRRRTTLGTLAAALVWGLFSAVHVYQQPFGESVLMLLLATAGIAAGGMAALAPARALMTGFLSLLLLPSAAATALAAGVSTLALPLLFAAFYTFLVLTGRRLHDEYWAALRNLHQLEAKSAELAAATHRNELLLNSVGDGIYGVDRAGLICFINPAGARMLGVSPVTLLGKPVQQFQVSDDQAAPATPAADEAVPGLFRRADGSTFPVHYLQSLLREHGEIAGAVVVFRDSTLREKLEAELRAAVTLAEEANLGKSQFLAAMGHELRTPLNGVLGITSLLDRAELTAMQRELLQALKHSAQTLLGSMYTILEYTSLESGATHPQNLNFHLPGAVRALMERYYRDAEKKTLQLEEVVDQDVPPLLYGDANLLQHLLAKLMDNAMKFTNHGRVRLRVRRAEIPTGSPGSAGPRLWLRFEVLDSGPGVPESEQVRIFEPFVQLGNTTTRQQGGLGLGLAIARRLTLLLGGRIGCESTSESGACFWCELPFTVNP